MALPISQPIKENILPHSPSHAHAMSPTILSTPELETNIQTPPEPFTFPKQPIQRPSTYSLNPNFNSGPASSIGTDSETGFSDDAVLSDSSKQPVSLLTALLHSAEKKKVAPKVTSTPGPGILSAKSSVPSTAFSSPTGTHHGILQNSGMLHHPPAPREGEPPASILRRGSTTASSDAEGLGLGLSMMTGTGVNAAAVGEKLAKVEEKREKIGWADDYVKPEAGPSVSRAPSTTRTCALKFAIAQPPSNPSSDGGEANTSRRTSLHRDSSAHSTSSHRLSPSPFARGKNEPEEILDDEEDEVAENQEDEDEEEDDNSDTSDVDLPGYKRPEATSSLFAQLEPSDDDSDAGYQEDEEDGAFSDEDEVDGIFTNAPTGQYPFARPTNYRRRRKGDRGDRRVASPSPPPAPAVSAPPNRRGRGHIRVLDNTAAGGKATKACSRHCSPPPSRPSIDNGHSQIKAPPAAASPSARKLSLRKNKGLPSRISNGKERSRSPNRLSDAGPRAGRAGSPMPSRINLDSNEDEDEEVEEIAQREELVMPATPPRARHGWRSDDSMFYGPNSHQARNALSSKLEAMPRNVSAPPDRTVFESDEEHTPTSALIDPAGSFVGDGMRNFLRRASEHLPMFRRPSIAPSESNAPSDREGQSAVTLRESAPIPYQATCPPALDDTPATAHSVSHRDHQVSSLASRLEQTLSTNAARPEQPGIQRASTVSGKVTFQTNSTARDVTTPQRAVSQTLSADEGVQRRAGLGLGFTKVHGEKIKPIACPKGSCRTEGDLGWTDEALRRIRKNAGKEGM